MKHSKSKISCKLKIKTAYKLSEKILYKMVFTKKKKKKKSNKIYALNV